MRLAFKNYPRVSAGLSERSDRNMVWWNRLPLPERVRQNRENYFKRQGIDPPRVVSGGIAHENKVKAVSEPEAGKYLLYTDALITVTPNLTNPIRRIRQLQFVF